MLPLPSTSGAFSSPATALASPALSPRLSLWHPLRFRAWLLSATFCSSSLYPIRPCGCNRSRSAASPAPGFTLPFSASTIFCVLFIIFVRLAPSAGSTSCCPDWRTYSRSRSCSCSPRGAWSCQWLYSSSSGLANRTACRRGSFTTLFG